MIKERNIYATELAIIILLWAFVVISPLLFMDNVNQNWMAVHIMWAECAVVGFVFIVNRFILMPRLFFAKRYSLYIICLTILFFLLGIFILYFDGVNAILSIFGEGNNIEPIHHPVSDMPFHDAAHQRPPHGGSTMGHRTILPPPTSNPPINTIIPPAVTVMILSAITIALDIGISISTKWIISEQKQAEIKKERISAQLSNLQSQVSPHFFMNTLNNIHALVEIDPQRAQKTIIELSGLMDYLLYDSSNKETVPIQHEMEFIKSYVNLMRLRYPGRVMIDFTHDTDIPSCKIPPLLFLNFIENTFKYGVDYTQESFIKINFRFSDEHIEMETINSNHSASVKTKRHGLGISNSRKRLKLLYNDKFKLEISDKKEVYCVNLKIPII